MSEVAHHVVWALAVLALAHAALRVASTVAPAGLERAIATAVIAIATAVAETLALGLVGLGASTIALAAAAGFTWLLALMLLPRPESSPWTELAGWWGRITGPGRLATAALGGAYVAWVAWQLRHPSIGFDSALYHYPDVAGWIANGRPGSILRLSYDIPYGNYPLTDEVVLTWGAGIARSWIPLALWEPVLVVLIGGASWLTLRNLSVPRIAAGIGTAVLVATPLVVHQLNEPETDLPALAWVACAAALAFGAKRRPALLAVAVVAAGLSVGTKTSAAPTALAALGVGCFFACGRLRALAGWLALGLAAAFVVGGFWYVRNLVQHGSPFWPFTATPWGTPEPRFYALINTTFLQRPVATLNGRLGAYASRLGGGWLLLVAVPLVLACGAFVRRWRPGLRRQLVVAATLSLVACLAWSAAWGTGLPTSPGLPGAYGWPISTIRYLLPVIGAAVITVALLARAPRPTGPLATVFLAVAFGWSVVADARLGPPYTPAARTLLAGALAGVVALGALVAGRWTLARARRARQPRGAAEPVPSGIAAVLASVAVGALLAPVGNGFVERYSKASTSTAPGADVLRWLWRQPGFKNSSTTIALATRAVLGPLAGDHFTHRLMLVPAHAPCNAVISLARRMPVVVTDPGFFGGILGVAPYDAPGCLATLRPAYQQGRVYRVYWLGAPLAETRSYPGESPARRRRQRHTKIVSRAP